MRSPSQFVRTWAVLAAGLLLQGVSAAAQARWTVEPTTSLAWWQVDPNLNHLWSTTCPGDPSWRPGEGRSAGWTINPALEDNPNGYAGVSDTVNMPLYPRHKVRALCPPALRGEIMAADTVHWRGVHGTVAARGDALATGETLRDVMMHQVLNTGTFPEIVFTLDSLVGLTHHGDTLVGSAAGTMTVRGQPTSVLAAVSAWRISGGMRVLAKWHVPAGRLYALAPTLHIYGLGLNTRIWQSFWMGADLVLRPEGTAAK